MMGLLEECPQCFWLHVVKGQTRPSGPFPSLPSGVDKLLKGHFDSYRAKGHLPPELAALDGACLFNDLVKLDPWRSNFKGIQHQEGDVLLKGAIDELLEKDGKFIVLDFKTRGFALKDDSHKYYVNQLNLYNYLFRKNGYDTGDYSYLLFYIPEKINGHGEFMFQTHLVKMPVNIDGAEKLVQKAISVIHDDLPASGPECGFCKWKNNGF